MDFGALLQNGNGDELNEQGFIRVSSMRFPEKVQRRNVDFTQCFIGFGKVWGIHHGTHINIMLFDDSGYPFSQGASKVYINDRFHKGSVTAF